MILYHVSTDLSHDGSFYPRVPEIRAEGENNKIERICCSKTVEGCFSAMPNGGMRLDVLNYNQCGYYKVFKIDTDKLDLNDAIVDSDLLFESSLVGDAELTEEVWLLHPFKVPDEDQYVIFLEDWHEEVVDVIPSYIYKLADMYADGDYLDYYMTYIGNVPCISIIENVTIHNAKEISVDTAIYIGDNKEFLQEYFKNDPSIEFNGGFMNLLESRDLTEGFIENYKCCYSI